MTERGPQPLAEKRTRRLGRFGAIFVAGILAAVPATGGLRALAASACTTTVATGYTVQVCVTQPADGSALIGDAPIAATVTLLSGKAAINDVVFLLSGQYLLADFESPWQFTLPSARFIDGPYTLAAYAELGSAKTPTSQANVNVTLHNGVTQIPPNTNSPNITPGTPPPAGQPAVVAAVGDGAAGESANNSVVNLINSWTPNLFLYLGDAYRNASVSEYRNWYDPTWGALRAITDPVIGNHEYGTPGGAAYFDYWNNVPSYYSFNSNGWHFIALNANPVPYFTSQQQQQQLTWLQSDLSANAGSCIAAYWHEPYLTVGSASNGGNQVKPLWQAIANAHVSVVLNGHDHTYQRWQPLDALGNPSASGVTEIVNGTGGHEIATITRADSRALSSLGGTKATGALKLALYPGSISYQFVQVSTGQAFDQGSIPCQTPPAVTRVSPSSGTTAGGTSVTISGSHFTSATSVSFGGRAAGSFTVISDNQITATSPSGSGTVDVTVTAPSGTSSTSSADHFSYTSAPAVLGVSPNRGPTAGGTSVTITGSNMTNASSVSFGGVAAGSFTVVSNSQITATSPAGTGTVDITVTTPGGTSATSSADQFTYVLAPVVLGVSPNSGPAAGGTSVTITGNHFTGATAVSFGGKRATSFSVVSDTQIVATSPSGTGTINILVTTAGGKSATSTASRFTYT